MKFNKLEDNINILSEYIIQNKRHYLKYTKYTSQKIGLTKGQYVSVVKQLYKENILIRRSTPNNGVNVYQVDLEKLKMRNKNGI